MDAKEIDARAKALQKASSAGEPAANIKNILEDLKKRVVPTEDLLRVSQRSPCYLTYMADVQINPGD